jgi:hypothetical protein
MKAAFLEQLNSIFKRTFGHEAHKEVAIVLENMSRNKEVLFEIIRENLKKEDLFTQKKLGPAMVLDIMTTRNYVLSGHIFFPVPSRQTNLAHNWIHHHDHSLLTTVNAFGEKGYRSFTFNKDFKYDRINNIVTNLHINKDFQHPIHNVEFVDAFEPHVVFLPGTVTITYALWSFDYKPKYDKLRSSKLFQAFKKPLKKIALLFYTPEELTVEEESNERQFVPEGDHFVNVGNILYTLSDNENLMQNLFYVLQEVGFKDATALEQLRLRAQRLNRTDVLTWIEKLLNNEPIADNFDPNHLLTKGLSFPLEDVVKAAAAC